VKLIRPATITETLLASSTVPETDHAVWSSVTTYALAARVIKAHRIWESTQASNTNHDPETAGVSWWIDAGPTNRWGMFDNVIGTATTASGSITVELEPGRIDALALLQIDASTADISMDVGGDTVFFRSFSLIDDSEITDWYMYFFEEIRPKDYLVIDDLPVFGEAVTTITLTKPAGTVSCGLCIVGMQSDIGGTRISPSLGINDYSKKTVDEFGNATFVQRSFSKRMSVQLVFNNSEIDRIHSVLSAVRATPAVWIGSDKYSSMLIYGFYRDFEVNIAYVNLSYCTLNIEGII
jgi:hypothetical protein